MIRFGIVGIGGFAGTWVRSLHILEERGIARLAAAVVRNRPKYAERVEALEARGTRIYDTYEEMLFEGHGTLDVIGVPTGTGFHEPMAIQAMEAGYNVVIEKPVAGTVQEVASIAATEERTGRWCAVGYQHIYTPTIQWMRRRLIDGRLGKIREARTIISWPRPVSYYERNAWAGQLRSNDRWILDGPATNATAHFINHMTYLVQAVEGDAFGIHAVRGELYRAKPIPSYDTTSIEIITRGGARLYHSASHATTEAIEPQSVFLCEKADVYWDRPSDTFVVKYHDGNEEQYANPDPSLTHAGFLEQIARVAEGAEAAPLCGIREAAPQVLIINLAFESSMGIRGVGEGHTYASELGGSPIVAIQGMEETLRRAIEESATFSDLGVPWAQRSEARSAEGYTRFPSEALGRILETETAGG